MQQQPVGGVQVVGHHPDTALPPLVLNGPADAPLAVGGDVDAGQGGILPEGVLGDLVGVVVPVEAGLEGEEMDVPLPRQRVQKTPEAAVVGAVVDVPGNGENQPAAGQHLPDQSRRRLPRPVAVHAHEAQPLAVRRVGVEGHHGHALFMEQADAPDQVRRVVGGNGQAVGPPVHQLVNLLEDLGGIPALDLPEFHLQAGGPEFPRGPPGPGGHVLHGGCFGGLEDGPQAEALPGPDQGLANGVGTVSQLLRDFLDAGGHLRVHPAPVVEGPVHRPPGDPRQLGDLL